MKYTFRDWVDNCELPPDSATLKFRWADTSDPLSERHAIPRPPKFREYRPAWGKGGPTQRQAVNTRNRNIYLRALETFRKEVLPLIADGMDNDSLFETGKDLRDAKLIDRSGYQFFVLLDDDNPRRGWLAPEDTDKHERAAAMGAYPIPADAWLEWMERREQPEPASDKPKKKNKKPNDKFSKSERH